MANLLSASWWRAAFARLTRPEKPAARARLWSSRTAAGVRVDSYEAMRNAVVWACVQYLSKSIAALPWHVLRETDSGSVRAPSNPVDWLIYRRPCPEYGAFSWRQTMMKWLLLEGNAFAEIERTVGGTPIALWPIHPHRVAVERDPDTQALVYRVAQPSGGWVLIPGADMLHFRGLGDGVVGMSVIEHAAQSIGWAQATEIFGSSYFSQGMNVSTIVKAKQGMSPESLALVRKEIETLYSGPAGKRVAVLDAGMEIADLKVTADEGQFIETRQHQVEEICRWFQVPPHKVMHLLHAHFTNVEHQSIEVVTDSLTPWAKVFEEEVDYKLLRDNRAGFYTKIDLRALLRGDHASRAAYYKTMVEIGAMTLNEVRALEDLNRVDNGDTRFVSQNLQALGADGMPVDRRPSDTAPEPERVVDGLRLPH